MNKQTDVKKSASSILRLVLGFLLGTIAYVVGFVVVGFVFDIVTAISILPSTISVEEASLTASALGANFLGLWLFSVIDKKEYHQLSFCIWQIVIAAIYLFGCLVYGDYHLLWYPILSFIINGIAIKQCVKPREEKQNPAP